MTNVIVVIEAGQIGQARWCCSNGKSPMKYSLEKSSSWVRRNTECTWNDSRRWKRKRKRSCPNRRAPWSHQPIALNSGVQHNGKQNANRLLLQMPQHRDCNKFPLPAVQAPHVGTTRPKVRRTTLENNQRPLRRAGRPRQKIDGTIEQDHPAGDAARKPVVASSRKATVVLTSAANHTVAAFLQCRGSCPLGRGRE